VRDGGCAVPGCDVDASRCEAHHITYWEHHGETSVSNMVLLCSKHHHMVHEGRWRIIRNEHLDPGDPGYVTLFVPEPDPAPSTATRLGAGAVVEVGTRGGGVTSRSRGPSTPAPPAW